MVELIKDSAKVSGWVGGCKSQEQGGTYQGLSQGSWVCGCRRDRVELIKVTVWWYGCVTGPMDKVSGSSVLQDVPWHH